jgi:hypothetical protein
MHDNRNDTHRYLGPLDRAAEHLDPPDLGAPHPSREANPRVSFDTSNDTSQTRMRQAIYRVGSAEELVRSIDWRWGLRRRRGVLLEILVQPVKRRGRRVRRRRSHRHLALTCARGNQRYI